MAEETKKVAQNLESQQQPEEAQSDLEERLQNLDSEPEQERTTESSPPPTEEEQLPDLSELDLPESQPQAQTTQEPAPELPDTPEAQKFAEDFKKYLGFDVKELRTGVQELQAYREQVAREKQQVSQERQLDALAGEWGVDRQELDNRMTQVLERFNKYPQEMQQRLDSLEGAKLIWAKIEQEQSKNGKVPTFQRSNGRATTGRKFLFTQSEIQAMSNEEYQRNADRIVAAYQKGLVDKSK